MAPLLATGAVDSLQNGLLCSFQRGYGTYVGVIKVWPHWESSGKRTCDDDGTILTSNENVGTSHFMQMCNVGAFCPDDAREARAIGKGKISDMGRRYCLLDRFCNRTFGPIDARLVTGLQIPRRLALLRVGVIFDDFPVGLSDGMFHVINPRRGGRRVRRTRGLRSSSRLGGRLGFHTEKAKSAKNGALRRHGILVLQWDHKAVCYGLRGRGIGNLRLRRHEHNHRLWSYLRDNQPSAVRSPLRPTRWHLPP